MHGQIDDYLQRTSAWTRRAPTDAAALLAALRRHAARPGAPPRHRPGHFLRETHVFPELADMVVRENALQARAAAARRHAGWCSPTRRATTSRRCCAPSASRATSTPCTPSRTPATAASRALHGFHRLLRKHNLDPHRCALVDDMPGEPARRASPRHVDGLGEPGRPARAVRRSARLLGHGTAALEFRARTRIAHAAPKANAGSRS